jgi:transposase, IS5 family
MQLQGSFSQAEYAGKKKQTRRDRFLAEMEAVVPWARLVERLRPLYPKGERGRPPIGLERMLRIHFLQQWYGLADGAMEDALYDSQALRGFADINQMAALLHGQEEDVFADAGYTGADKRPELEDRDVCWNIAIKRSIIKALPKGLRDLAEPVERALAQVRAWVEHPFHIVKNLFRHKKLRYRGLAKNTAQLHTLFALANLVIVKKTLLVQSRA